MMTEEMILGTEEDVFGTDDQERFVVDTADKADWCIEKIRAARAQQEQNNEIAKAILERKKAEVEAWLVNQNAYEEDTICRMEVLLKPYIEEQLKDSNKKSVKLPSGTIGYKSQPILFRFRGKDIDASLKKDADFLAFANACGDEFVKTEQTVAWGDLKKNLIVDLEGHIITKDGEIIDDAVGLSYTVVPDKFYVK